jgi:hypothetical protein
MRGSTDEVGRPVAQGRVGLVDRIDQLELDIETLCFETAELDCRYGGKVRIRNHVGYGKLHLSVSHFFEVMPRPGLASRAKVCCEAAWSPVNVSHPD